MQPNEEVIYAIYIKRHIQYLVQRIVKKFSQSSKCPLVTSGVSMKKLRMNPNRSIIATYIKTEQTIYKIRASKHCMQNLKSIYWHKKVSKLQ